MHPVLSRRPTPREMEVLQLIWEGRSTKQIACFLGISFKTAACHRTHLMDKAGVHDLIRLMRWALAEGYVTLSTPDEVDSRITENSAPRAAIETPPTVD